MSSDVCDRIVLLEASKRSQDEKLEDMRRRYDKTAEKVDDMHQKLNSTLFTIKWCAITCVATIVAQQSGILDAIKMVFLK